MRKDGGYSGPDWEVGGGGTSTVLEVEAQRLGEWKEGTEPSPSQFGCSFSVVCASGCRCAHMWGVLAILPEVHAWLSCSPGFRRERWLTPFKISFRPTAAEHLQMEQKRRQLDLGSVHSTPGWRGEWTLQGSCLSRGAHTDPHTHPLSDSLTHTHTNTDLLTFTHSPVHTLYILTHSHSKSKKKKKTTDKQAIFF